MKRNLILFLFFILLIPTVAHGQTNPTLSVLEISLWPEYDRPEVLIIYHAALSSEVSLPTEVTFRIPRAASKPNAVAVGPAQGSVGDVPYTTQVDGDWMLITFTAAMPVIQFEYYDPTLRKDGTARHFEYQWPGDYPVQALAVEVQQPLGATDMRISPALGNAAARQDGLLYYHSEVGTLAAGQTFRLSFDYQKESEALSVENLQVQPSAPLTPQTTGRVDVMKALPWVLGGLGILLLVGGIVWYVQSGGVKPAASPERRRHRPARQEIGESPTDSGVYCHQCGKRAAAGDHYCRSCGTRLQVE